MVQVTFGVGLGIALALSTTHYLSQLLYGLSGREPSVFLAAAAVLSLVALIACLVPALRAIRVDPATSLRHD